MIVYNVFRGGRPPSVWLRLKMFLTGVAFPPICFVSLAAGAEAVLDDQWQSGEVTTYIAMLMTWSASQVFIPLILFSMICMSVWIVQPDMERHLIVRLGIHTGSILSMQFLFLVFCTSGPFTFVFAAIVGSILAAVCWFLSLVFRRSRRFSIFEILIATTILAIPAALLRNSEFHNLAREFLFSSYFSILAATPTLNAVTYIGSSIWLFSNRSQKLSSSPQRWLIAWLSSFVVTWRLAILRMFEEYEKLPTSQPQDCYVSSAAASGHRRFVSAEVICKDNVAIVVNMQMRRLKLLEFALQAQFPAAHHRIRKIYNRIGPSLAATCAGHKLFADLTYLLLMPFEAAAEIVRRLLSIESERVEALYGRGSQRIALGATIKACPEADSRR